MSILASMVRRHELTDVQWEGLQPLPPFTPGDPVTVYEVPHD